ncbi:MAG: Energy-dependent translational throttle protein EttA, partial [uncultured Phycisphaerae bacterium]
EQRTKQDHLLDGRRLEELREEGRPEGDLPLVLLRRQDRRAGPQRLGQELAAAHPGRHRHEVRGRDQQGPGLHRRLSRAGAEARPERDRAPSGRGGGGRDGEAAERLQRDQRQARRPGPRPRRDGAAAREAGRAPGEDRAQERVGPRPAARDGDGRAPHAARRRGDPEPVRRREAARRAVPAAAPEAGRPAARRADEPPRRRERAVARAAPEAVRGDDHRRHPRPLLPRQRGRLDPRARPRAGDPVEGQLQLVARAEGRPAARRGGQGIGPAEGAGARAGMGPRLAAGPAGQEQGAPREVRADARREPAREGAADRDLHPAGAAARREGDRGGRRVQELRGQAAVPGPVVQPAARRDRRHHRAERRGQDDAVPPDHRPGRAGRRRVPGGREREARVHGPEPRGAEGRRHDLARDQRRAGEDQARRRRDRQPGLRRALRLHRHRPAEAARDAVRRPAQPRPPRPHADARRQRVAARRADERHRRQHDARARGGDRELRRLRRGHQPRPLVPRPRRDAHPRVRGRQPGRVVRRQLLQLRGRPQAAHGHGGRPAAPDQVPADGEGV